MVLLYELRGHDAGSGQEHNRKEKLNSRRRCKQYQPSLLKDTPLIEPRSIDFFFPVTFSSDPSQYSQCLSLVHTDQTPSSMSGFSPEPDGLDSFCYSLRKLEEWAPAVSQLLQSPVNKWQGRPFDFLVRMSSPEIEAARFKLEANYMQNLREKPRKSRYRAFTPPVVGKQLRSAFLPVHPPLATRERARTALISDP